MATQSTLSMRTKPTEASICMISAIPSKDSTPAQSTNYLRGNMSKYHNIKTRTTDGVVHDSIKEANRWCELNLLLKAGIITDLQRQVKFELLPKQEGERAVHYIADFVYTENGKKVVEDVKGVRTKEYLLKRKMLLYFHGIKIKEI